MCVLHYINIIIQDANIYFLKFSSKKSTKYFRKSAKLFHCPSSFDKQTIFCQIFLPIVSNLAWHLEELAEPCVVFMKYIYSLCESVRGVSQLELNRSWYSHGFWGTYMFNVYIYCTVLFVSIEFVNIYHALFVDY